MLYSASLSSILCILFSLFYPNSGAVNFTVNTSYGAGLSGVNITMDSMGAGEDYNLTTDSDGKAFYHSLRNYTYNITVDGSPLGYAYNNTQVQIASNTFNILNYVLTPTEVNITLYNDQGQPIENVTVRMASNPVFQNVTNSSGSVLFSVVPTGTYNITFAGDRIGTVYFISGSSQTELNITSAMSGAVAQLNYTFNETRARVNITNDTAVGIGGLNLTITNSTGDTIYNNTEGNSSILLTALPYGNYTVSFNSSQLYTMGYIPQTPVLDVQAGEDEDSANLFNVTLNDIEAVFNVSNTTGDGLDGVVIQMLLNGSSANNALGELLNGSTNSTGGLVLHLIKPEAYAGGTYSYHVFANISGYGDWYNYSGLTVGTNGTGKNVQLEPLSITVNVYNSTGDIVSEPVNISILQGGQTAVNASGYYLNATGITANVTFTHLYVGNYTINITSDSYFSQERSFTTANVSSAGLTESFNLTPRRVSIYLYDTNTSQLITDNIEVGLYNSTGDLAQNTTGDYMNGSTSTGAISFYGVPDGMFSINTTSNAYFNTSTSFDTSAGVYSFSLNLSKRNIWVYIYDRVFRTAVTESMTVAIYNSTGIETNTTGDAMQQTTSSGSVLFNGVRTGAFNISVLGANFTAQNQTLDTSTGNYVFNFYMNRTFMSYFNITVRRSDNNDPVSGITVNLVNGSSAVKSGSTDSDGNILLAVNSSRYSSLNITTESTSSYYANTSGGEYSANDQVISNITVTVLSKPSGGSTQGTTGGDGGGGGGGGAAACNESWVCTSWSTCINGIQTRTCTDQNNCGTEKDKPDTNRSCFVKIGLSAPAVYLNANQCQSLPITVKNLGNVPLTDVRLRDTYSIPGCCSLSSAQSLEIQPLSDSILTVTVCAPKSAEKGEYTGAVAVRSAETSGTLTVYVYLTKNYQEVLSDRADSLLQQLDEMDTSQFSAAQASWYNAARNAASAAKASALAGDTDAAERQISEAEDALSKISAPGGPAAGMWWVLWLLAPVAVGAGAFLLWKFYPRKRQHYVYKPAPTIGPAPVSGPPAISKEALLDNLKELEARVKSLDGKKLGAVEAQYHEKARRALNQVKNSILNDNFVTAKRALNAAETELKVLEARLLSMKFMKTLKE